ncbi:MAG: hypothetical protein PWP25_1312 [Sphaerochaeta sp.]|jgi:hypothetical protein|nr:hypothetical protein [Sphaerochaeta sp.]MDN5334222.1 hypothetical protein [Sphaerochaeta sp.]
MITADGGNVWMNAFSLSTSCWNSLPAFLVTKIPIKIPNTLESSVAAIVNVICAPVIWRIVFLACVNCVSWGNTRERIALCNVGEVIYRIKPIVSNRRGIHCVSTCLLGDADRLDCLKTHLPKQATFIIHNGSSR